MKVSSSILRKSSLSTDICDLYSTILTRIDLKGCTRQLHKVFLPPQPGSDAFLDLNLWWLKLHEVEEVNPDNFLKIGRIF